MDSAKHNASRGTPDTEETGIFRRPSGLPEVSDAGREPPPVAGEAQHPPASAPDRERDPRGRPPASGAERPDRRRAGAGRDERPRESASSAPVSEAELQVRSLEGSDLGTVSYDAKGNPVWEWRVNVQRRRRDDTTVNMLKCLDTTELRLLEDTDEGRDADRGIDPYDHQRR